MYFGSMKAMPITSSFRFVQRRCWRSALVGAACAFLTVNTWLAVTASQTRPMPDGPGKEETRKLCSNCHELDKSLSLKQDKAGWQRTVEKMVSFGMKASEGDVSTVIEYLSRSYPADDVPRLKVNSADAIEFESILSLKRSQAAAIIAYREKNGPFKSLADLKKVPGLEAAKLDAKKDRLIFE
jgi:competence protein ComEA